MAAAWIAESCSDETCSDATYYVAKTGNNTIGDGTVGKPWLMITKGANADKLNVKAGTYRETIAFIKAKYSRQTYFKQYI